jgi:DNA-binding transcriptional ArsR family regulator
MSEDSLFDDDQPDDLAAIPPRSARKKRKPFKAQWVKLPRYWVEAVQQSKSASTYQLAMAILFEAFKREHLIGEIVLSSTMTKMPRCTKMRAARELVELGLIKIRQDGNQAVRVTLLHSKKRR